VIFYYPTSFRRFISLLRSDLSNSKLYSSTGIMRPDEANKKVIAKAALAKKIFPLEIPECL